MSNIDPKAVIEGIQEAAERMGLDYEDLAEMIPDLLEDSIEKTKNLLQSIEAGDQQKIVELAHDVKGASYNYGLNIAGDLAKQIEKEPEASETLSRTEKLLETLQIIAQVPLF